MKYEDQQENLRVVGDFKLIRTDPFGFWIIRSLKGTTPKALENESFTNTQMALAALKNHLDNQKAVKPKEK